MIEVIGARSGDRTISFNGKLLASSIDPRQEAERWCEKNADEVKGIKTAFVIGAGAAYHLAILQRSYPHLKILCIEFNKDIIKQVRNSIEISLLGVDIIAFENMYEIFQIQKVRDGLSSSYRVLAHPSSQVHSPELTSELVLQLNGRLEMGLREILLARGVDEKTEFLKTNNNELFSILSIEKIFLENNLGDARSFQATKELLK